MHKINTIKEVFGFIQSKLKKKAMTQRRKPCQKACATVTTSWSARDSNFMMERKESGMVQVWIWLTQNIGAINSIREIRRRSWSCVCAYVCVCVCVCGVCTWLGEGMNAKNWNTNILIRQLAGNRCDHIQ